VRGNLNGRLFGSMTTGPFASSDISSLNSSPPTSSGIRGIRGWLNRGVGEPKTSTPQDRRHVQPVEDSFGHVTPIREGDYRPSRIGLGRPSLDSFGRFPGNVLHFRSLG
jgi:hypothetical protein